MPRYNPAQIEPKWQHYWAENQTFRTPRLPVGPKLYVLDMFPYPSGDGLHVGHPEGYTATDIVCRFRRMQGYSVLHPMGYDAFGLPAEQHAKKTGTPPRTTTEKNIGNFRRQLRSIGFSYDWDRELATTDVDYFRWTQWIFLVLFDTWYDAEAQRGRPIAELPVPADVRAAGEEAVRRYQDSRRLAYQLEAPVNWCPALGTVLANEEVVGGVSERGGHPVVRLPLRQWMLRITAYADRLLADLEGLDWSEGIKALQRNWIGRSTGAEVDFFIGRATADERAAAGWTDKIAFEDWKQARAQAAFPEAPSDDVIRIYTTRPDTLFGATYMVVAPEHPLVDRLTTQAQRSAVSDYRERAMHKSDLDRTDLAKDKSGVFTGAYAINPINAQPIPVWIADYVLMSYGTGAIMAVPAHDTRDFEFAEKFGLPIVEVVSEGALDRGTPPTPPYQGGEAHRDANRAASPPYQGGGRCFAGDGTAINSAQYDGLSTAEFKPRIAADLADAGLGRQAVNYKLRDWLFSRQHFWGEPFPILHELDAAGRETGLLVAVDPSELPVDLPEMPHFESHGRPEPPLEQAPESWLYVERGGRRYKRETNTMPQWAGSCWYYLRFLDPKNSNRFIDPEIERAWMPVDLYVGGAEHAVLHLLYARFWHKVLYDRGHVSTVEPFHRLVNQGMILGEIEFTGYRATDQAWVSAVDVRENAKGQRLARDGREVSAERVAAEQVEKRGDHFVLTSQPDIVVESRAHKMSKSRGNVVNPDQVVAEYGADALRLYEMFMGPLEATKPWSMAGVSGVRGFLDRAWRLVVDDRAEELVINPSVQDVELAPEQRRVLHKTIAAVTKDTDALSFNTAISRMMEFVNYFTKADPRPKEALEKFSLLLAPYAPHLAEELWQLLGHSQSLAHEPWPTFDPEALREDQVEIPVQINGKVRGRVLVAPDADAKTLEAAARAEPRVEELLADKQLVKVVAVPGRMVNFVVKG